ncbi:MAG: hypothetical protein HND57_14320 [Planctomycetes bacterium]|nr:hypothetical protein [Planctomycetota bacterium]
MGLDAVELVMEVEQQFDVVLTDSDCRQVLRVADLAAVVANRLPDNQGGCTTAGAFYLFRRLLLSQTGIKRADIRPATPLSDLFPSRESRNKWHAMEKQDGDLPRLEVDENTQRSIDAVRTFLYIPLIVLFVFLFVTFHWAIAILWCVAGIAVLGIGSRAISELRRTRFPDGFETVADVARSIAPMQTRAGGPGQTLIMQQEVLLRVRLIIADLFSIPIEEIKPESRLYRDLLIG